MKGITCREEDCSFLGKGLEMISNELKILKLSRSEANAKLFSVFVSNDTRLPILAEIDLSHTTINSFQVSFLLGKCDNLIEISLQNCKNVTDHVFHGGNYLSRSS